MRDDVDWGSTDFQKHLNRQDDPLYTTADISEEVEQHQDLTGLIEQQQRDNHDEHDELAAAIAEAEDVLADRYDDLADFVATRFPDHVPEDDLTDSRFPGRAMVRAYVWKMLSPDISSFDLLTFRLENDRELAERMEFDPDDIPDRTTFSTQWWERYRPAFRRHVRYEAAYTALRAQQFGLEISERGEELIDEFSDTGDDEGDIPEEYRLEKAERDRVFNEYEGLFTDLLDYGRAENWCVPSEDLTELATFTARRNESMVGGRDVYVSEHAVTNGGYITSEALAKPIRKYSRMLAKQRFARHDAIPPGEARYDWSVDPEDRDFGEGESWHKRTERGIEEQVEMLKSRGMLDRPVDLCIDGTAREYNNRNDTDVEEPDGVLHRYPKYETGYAWEDITITAIYRGRAIVLASISKVKADSQFQCVRYLLDRARDLVNARHVYADSEFGTQKICSYISHCGLDYVIKKRKTSTVKDFFDEADGRADWTDYEIEGKDHTKHKTTLVALESTSKAVTKKGEQRKQNEETDDGRTQTTLPGTGPAEDEEEEEDIKLEAWVTSLDVVARGLAPKVIGPRREEHTAFGVGQLYRNRWSIETAFRDIKQNFKAKPRSRCLGVRRFFFMLCLLLYNCWVLLNLIVADEADHRDDDEIIWRKKIFIIDLHNEVFADREFG